jgi:hypothetical protein
MIFLAAPSSEDILGELLEWSFQTANVIFRVPWSMYRTYRFLRVLIPNHSSKHWACLNLEAVLTATVSCTTLGI